MVPYCIPNKSHKPYLDIQSSAQFGPNLLSQSYLPLIPHKLHAQVKLVHFTFYSINPILSLLPLSLQIYLVKSCSFFMFLSQVTPPWNPFLLPTKKSKHFLYLPGEHGSDHVVPIIEIIYVHVSPFQLDETSLWAEAIPYTYGVWIKQ